MKLRQKWLSVLVEYHDSLIFEKVIDLYLVSWSLLEQPHSQTDDQLLHFNLTQTNQLLSVIPRHNIPTTI